MASETPDADASVASSLLIIQHNVHIIASFLKLKPLKMDRPRIERGSNELYGTCFCKNRHNKRQHRDDTVRKMSSILSVLL